MRARAARTSAGAALALAVMQPAPAAGAVGAALAAVGDPAVAAERLTFHGAWGHAHRVVTSLGLAMPGWLQEHGEGRRARTLEQHLRTLHDLAALAAVLDGAGVPWLTFKGPTVSALYPHPDLRAYTDLDVLVAPHDLRAAVAALLAARWPVLETPRDLDQRPPVGEIHLRGPAGTPVDLHWHLFYRADHMSRSRLDVGALVSARQHGRVGTTRVPTLPPATHIAYVCAHAAGGGANRLRWLTDVAHLGAAASHTDWSDVVVTSRAWGVPESVSLVLSRASRHVGAAVPAWVAPELGGHRTMAMAAVAELVDPLPASAEHRSATAAVARAADRPLAGAVLAGLRARRTRAGRRASAVGLPHREDVTTLPEGLGSLSRFVDSVTDEAARGTDRTGSEHAQ